MRTAHLLTVSFSIPCISLGGGVFPHSWMQTRPRRQKEWRTLVKILPCPKLRLQAVIKETLLFPQKGLVSSKNFIKKKKRNTPVSFPGMQNVPEYFV